MLKQFIVDDNIFELKILNINFIIEENLSQLTLQLEQNETIENLRNFIFYTNQSDRLKVTLESSPTITVKINNPKIKLSINERDNSLNDEQARPNSLNLDIKGEIDFE